MAGIIYLVQPAELLGTDRYKVGCSGSNTLKRCSRGYKVGTRYLIIMECEHPYYVEKQLKRVFTDKFRICAGKEYFSGNEKEMIYSFMEIFKMYAYDKPVVAPVVASVTASVTALVVAPVVAPVVAQLVAPVVAQSAEQAVDIENPQMQTEKKTFSNLFLKYAYKKN